MTVCGNCGSTLVVTNMDPRHCANCGAKTRWHQTGKIALTKGHAERILARHESRETPKNWQDAEGLACKWMRANGYRDARLSVAGPDGGVDVIARKAIAQVKHHQRPVGLGEIQRFFGIASAVRKEALFFSANGFTPAATAWAKEHGVKLYKYPPVRRV